MTEADKEIRGWFKDHKASLCVLKHLAPDLNDKTLWWLRWKKPGTVICWVDYIMTQDGRLMVTGDLGAGIYQWCLDSALRDDPLAFVANCDLGYFASKCVASEKGRKYTEWFEDKALVGLVAWTEEAEGEEKTRRLTVLHDGLYPALGAILAEADWVHWLEEFGHEAFGADWTEWADIGMGIDICCRAHLIGLKMAMAQIKTPDIS